MNLDVTRFFHPVLPSHALKAAPVGVSLAGVAYVLFRTPDGRVAALLDRCPHRHAPLSAGKMTPDGRLQCGYHGWTFDVLGRGVSPTQPELARCDATALQAVERLGFIWIAARGVGMETFPDLGVDGFSFAGSYVQRFEAPLHVVLDNFSEDEHTPYVHTRLGWDASQVGEVEFTAENHEDHTSVVYAAPQRPSRLARLLMLKRGDWFHNSWQTWFDPVRTVYDIRWTQGRDGPPRPIITRTPIFFVPVNDTVTHVVVFTFVKVAVPALTPLLPLIKPAAVVLGWLEVRDDRRFISTVAATPPDLKGMRLGRYDKPLIHNHKLLQRIYWGQPQTHLLSVLKGPVERV